MAQGFAGCFHIFGHGGCSGGAGHCEIKASPRPYDPRRAHPLTPTRKAVMATEALHQVMSQSQSVRITVIATVTGGTERCDLENVLAFERISIDTYGG